MKEKEEEKAKGCKKVGEAWQIEHSNKGCESTRRPYTGTG
jgi:hypothetical protein